jgi:hypothetical protein
LEVKNACPNEGLFLPCGALPQREQIIIKYKATLHGVPGQRIRSSSLCEGALFHTPVRYLNIAIRRKRSFLLTNPDRQVAALQESAAFRGTTDGLLCALMPPWSIGFEI